MSRRFLRIALPGAAVGLVLFAIFHGLVGAGPLVPQVRAGGPPSATAASSPDPVQLQQLKEQLSPEQFHVTMLCGTEPPFRNAYWNNKDPGIYVCVISGKPLFSSLDKFDSGTGWPSFTRPIDESLIEAVEDTSHGMVRTEVRSKPGNSHLGHVFPDGPQPTGNRFCINSASLRFVHLEDLEKEGYGEFKKLFEKP